MVGFIPRIRAGGFSGTVGTIWVVDYRKRMIGRFDGGLQCVVISARSKNIANLATRHVMQGNVKRCCIGRMIVVNTSAFDRSTFDRMFATLSARSF